MEAESLRAASYALGFFSQERPVRHETENTALVYFNISDIGDSGLFGRDRDGKSLLRRRHLLCRHRFTTTGTDDRAADRQRDLQLHAELDTGRRGGKHPLCESRKSHIDIGKPELEPDLDACPDLYL